MHSGRIKMEFKGFRGFKRMYSCPICRHVCGIERKSNGKVPFCTGSAVLFRVKQRDDTVTWEASPTHSSSVYQEPTRQPVNAWTEDTTF